MTEDYLRSLNQRSLGHLVIAAVAIAHAVVLLVALVLSN